MRQEREQRKEREQKEGEQKEKEQNERKQMEKEQTERRERHEREQREDRGKQRLDCPGLCLVCPNHVWSWWVTTDDMVAPLKPSWLK